MSLITQEQLMEWLHYDQAARVEKFLRDNRIPYFHGKGGVLCTTQAAIDLRLIKGESRRPEVEFI